MRDKVLIGKTSAPDVSAIGARLAAVIAGVFRAWRERWRTRRDLAMMSDREWRELGVSEATVREEVSRLPWFDYSPEWRSRESERRAGLTALLQAARSSQRHLP